MKSISLRPILFVLLGVTTVLVIGVSGFIYFSHQAPRAVAVVAYKTPEEADMYVRFDMEVYDSIAQNYFARTQDYKLPTIFELSFQKVASTTDTLSVTDRASVARMLAAGFASTTKSVEDKRKLALDVAIVVLYNLEPAGRNGILSKQQEVALRQEVSNINPSKDLYQNIGTTKNASPAEVEKAYTTKVAVLSHATTTVAKEELQQATYAHKVLTNSNSKALYDQAQIEPTVFGHVVGHTLYLSMSKISPTTLREFAFAVDAASTTPRLESMILDLRGNIGGSLDFMTNFLGLFIGQNQFAFDLYRQGDYHVQRTSQPKFGELDRYKDIAIMTDSMTQSTAEVAAATFKRFHMAHVVGGKTRGWGTVENTYPLDTVIDPSVKYSLLLVNSITLRDDNMPVEGRGVDPDVDTTKANWKSELGKNFTSASLISALLERVPQSPLTY